ncbi:MAG TPA: GGDEF domain-containing protein [Actinoplanes sp.]|nr:GGDEF domain-containing protein [Actinoplanes sp.]
MRPQIAPTRRGRPVLVAFLLLTSAAIAVHAVSGPAVQRAVFFSIIALPTIGVFVAMRLNPAMDRWVWATGAVGLGLQAVMALIWPTYFADDLGRAQGSLADLSIAGAHGFLLAAAVLVVYRTAAGDPGGVIDAAIIGLCASAPLWEWVLHPQLVAIGAPTSGQAVILLDVLSLGGVFGSLARIATTTRRGRPTLCYLLLAILLTFVAITVAVLTAGSPGHGAQAELLIGAFLAFGFAPLHPAVAYLTAPDRATPRRLNRSNLVFLALALTVFPVIALVQLALGRPSDPLLFGLGSLVTVPLVAVRLGQLNGRRERAERVLAHHARHDELTGLPNRRAMLEEIDNALARVRDGSLAGVGLLFCDLNGFKPINDTWGHQAGDTLLEVVAARLTACSRAGDTVGRFGGDEFVILCPGISEAEVQRLRTRVEEAVAAPAEVTGATVAVGVSVGTAVSDRDSMVDRDALVSAADARMYEQKRRTTSPHDRTKGRRRPRSQQTTGLPHHSAP